MNGIVALQKLDAEPGVALKDLNLGGLETVHDRLAELESLHDTFSGACSTLKGLVLIQIKEVLPRGEWMPWVKGRYQKSHRTATNYIRLGKQFMAESKLAQHCQFAALVQDMATTLQQIEEAKLDLRHPTVNAVVQWSHGRSAHQLLLELGPAERGGDTSMYPRKNPPTHEEEHDSTLEAWSLLVNELQDRAFGNPPYKVEWDRLTTRELAELDDRILRVHQHFADTLKARK